MSARATAASLNNGARRPPGCGAWLATLEPTTHSSTPFALRSTQADPGILPLPIGQLLRTPEPCENHLGDTTARAVAQLLWYREEPEAPIGSLAAPDLAPRSVRASLLDPSLG